MRLDNDRNNLWCLCQVGKQARPHTGYLAERFTNKIERPSEFFHRAFQAQHAAVVIPHRNVLAFYTSMLQHSSMAVLTYALVDAGSLYSIVKSGLHRDVGKEYSERCPWQPKRGVWDA
jgi:hypothetical protein